ncbi:thiosulfate:glutathione sulfurtransferase [Paramormyrops kingsleyae]|uniref:thiosulfate:glutathione sulfurtransferase n=1 Tax=Paramormyrops kingsleyae TaxID=1676925 RepID=UPI003B96C29E
MDKKEISHSELKALIGKSPDLLLIDVRTKEEVDKGKIPGSIHMPVDSVDRDLALDPAAFQAKFGVQKPSLDAPELVFHCQMGRRGALAVEKAHALGFTKARNYAGGYKEWSEKAGK